MTNDDRRGLLRFADLFLASFLMMLFEFAILRWLPSYVRIVAYFSNVILISCFAGFGLGCILKNKRSLLPAFPPLALAELLATRYLSVAGVDNPFGSHEAFFTTTGAGLNWYVVIPALFVLNAALFAALGQAVARELDRFEPLEGYTVNVFGGLLGVGGFAAMSFLLRPTWWFLACFAAALRLLRRSSRLVLGLALASFAAGALVVHEKEVLSFWSPYSKLNAFELDLAPGTGSFQVAANNELHQTALNLSDAGAKAAPFLRQWRASYDLPYRLRGRAPRRVLILGAGTGNDVAAALRAGASEVVAVELDPEIARLGRDYHPERPYADPRVTLVTGDARRAVRRDRTRYDMIVMGWLDSHRLFSNMSNIRQDNFVYTAESLVEIRERLEPDGLLCLSFFVGQPWIAAKIVAMVRAAFHHDPRVLASTVGGYGRAGQIFVTGLSDAAASSPTPAGFEDLSREILPPAAMPTDDWPFLYYRNRTLTAEYAWTLLILFAATAAMVLLAVPRKDLRVRGSLTMFSLGAGFMLLEARNVTVLALVFGSGWITTSVVISAVLAMILVANALVERGLPRKEDTAWLGLLGSLCLTLAIGGGAPGPVQVAAVSLTFLFAGIVFAKSFMKSTAPGASLGWNVLGAVFGGLAEYACLIVGLRALLLLALAFYAVARLARTGARRHFPLPS